MEVTKEFSRFLVLSDGWTVAPEAALLKGGQWTKRIRLYATAFLLRHPERGWVLVDTGYSTRVARLGGLSGFLYRFIVGATISNRRGVRGVLQEIGVERREISDIILTHLHPDHIGGLRDFPETRILLHRSGIVLAKERRKLRNAFFPELLPRDFFQRAKPISDDVFGDGSLLSVELPGHAVGQIGLLFSCNGRKTLLAADACWLSRSYLEGMDAPMITGLIHDSREYRHSLNKLCRMRREADGKLDILPSHCPRTANLICAP